MLLFSPGFSVYNRLLIIMNRVRIPLKSKCIPRELDLGHAHASD